MPIIVNLDVMMAKRKMSLNELSEKVGLSKSNPVQYIRNDLQSAEMPAGGYS